MAYSIWHYLIPVIGIILIGAGMAWLAIRLERSSPKTAAAAPSPPVIRYGFGGGSLALVAILAAGTGLVGGVIGGVHVAMFDMAAAIYAPEKETGISRAVMRITGGPSLGPRSIGRAALELPDTMPSAPQPEPPRERPIDRVGIVVGKPFFNSQGRMKAEVTVINNNAVMLRKIGGSCICRDENGAFGDGGFMADNIASGARVPTIASCFETSSGNRQSMECLPNFAQE